MKRGRPKKSKEPTSTPKRRRIKKISEIEEEGEEEQAVAPKKRTTRKGKKSREETKDRKFEVQSLDIDEVLRFIAHGVDVRIYHQVPRQ